MSCVIGSIKINFEVTFKMGQGEEIYKKKKAWKFSKIMISVNWLSIRVQVRTSCRLPTIMIMLPTITSYSSEGHKLGAIRKNVGSPWRK